MTTLAKGYDLAILAGPKPGRDGSWPHNVWRCKISEQASGRQIWAGEYRTGLAIERPTLDDVLCSLLRDADSVEACAESLEGFCLFCSLYGIQDLSEAIKTYRECCRIRALLLASLKFGELERLTALYQDY